MTTQEINERIAKLCGWEKLINGTWVKNGHFYDTLPPQYTESLDLCRGFEKEYTFGEQEEVFDGMVNRIGAIDAIFATPLQRCEAFLRLKGQWE